MKETVEELRAKLETLHAEAAEQYAALVPLAVAAGGPVRWRDCDVAVWLGVTLGAVRENIVDHLQLDAFAVGGEGCEFALLNGREVLLLLECKSARAAEIEFVLAELYAVDKYLNELGSGPGGKP